jgi:hypothetical protein
MEPNATGCTRRPPLKEIFTPLEIAPDLSAPETLFGCCLPDKVFFPEPSSYLKACQI